MKAGSRILCSQHLISKMKYLYQSFTAVLYFATCISANMREILNNLLNQIRDLNNEQRS